MKVLLMLPLLLALGACATTSRPLAVADARAMDPARVMEAELFSPTAERTVPVRIAREPASIGRLMQTMLVVDGRAVAMLQPGRTATLYLSPGAHVFAIGYAKRPETRPLARRELVVGAGLQDDFHLRLYRGREPVIRRVGEDDAAARLATADYTLPPCEGESGAIAPGAVAGPQFVDGRICLASLPAAVPADLVPTWADLGNLEEYADPTRVAQVVDDAIRASGLGDWVKGKAGRHLDQNRRYLYTRRAGWIDLKHVICSASNPGAYVPGLSRATPWFIEVAQVQVAPMSAFLREDTVSNRLGADAAVRHAATFGRHGSRGAIVQSAIDRLEPLTLVQALREFGVEVPPDAQLSQSQAAPSPAGAPEGT